MAGWSSNWRGWGLTERLDRPTGEVAALIVAIDIGLGVQHLVAPEATPGKLYARALELLLGDALDPKQTSRP